MTEGTSEVEEPSGAQALHATASGKFLRAKAFKRHILTSKSTKRKRSLRKVALVSDGDQMKLERMLPYK